MAGSREGVARLCCWCGVVTGLLSQTAVHFAENRRKWPDLGEVDCILGKAGGVIGPMGGSLGPSMRTLTPWVAVWAGVPMLHV